MLFFYADNGMIHQNLPTISVENDKIDQSIS